MRVTFLAVVSSFMSLMFNCGLSYGGVLISPVSMTATSPLEITPNTIEILSAQTELSRKQLQSLEVVPGTMDEERFRKLSEIGDDPQSRRFLDYLDSTISLRNERFSPEQTPLVEISSADPWRALLQYHSFVSDAIEVGSLTLNEQDLHTILGEASKSGSGEEQIRARGRARALLSEARQGAIRRARGYRILGEIFRREKATQGLAPNITMILDIRSPSKQPTIAPTSEVRLLCPAPPVMKETAPTLRGSGSTISTPSAGAEANSDNSAHTTIASPPTTNEPLKTATTTTAGSQNNSGGVPSAAAGNNPLPSTTTQVPVSGLTSNAISTEQPNNGDTETTLQFDEKTRTCDKEDRCRMMLITDATKSKHFNIVYEHLKKSGRAYLENCKYIKVFMLIDGEEVVGALPGKYLANETSNTTWSQ